MNIQHNEYLNKSQILSRGTWTKAMIESIIGEPDEVERNKSGKPRNYKYSLKRVENAEATTEFQTAYRHGLEQAEEEEREFRNFIESTKYAINHDLDRLRIRTASTFHETFAEASSKMVLLADIEKQVETMLDFNANKYREVTTHLRYQANMEICKRIAEEYPNFGFEAGCCYKGLENVYTTYGPAYSYNRTDLDLNSHISRL